MSTGTDGGGSEGTTEVGTSSNDRPTSSNEGNVSITPPDNSKRRGQEDGSVVGAIVAAFVVVFLIIAVVVTSIIIYLSRQRIEQALGRTIGKAPNGPLPLVMINPQLTHFLCRSKKS